MSNQLLEHAENMALALEEHASLAVLNMSGATPEMLVEYEAAQVIRQLVKEIERQRAQNTQASWDRYEVENLRRAEFERDALNNPMGQ